jgi:adenylate cyclase
VAADLPQRLAAILAADIAGYTRLMELDEAGTVAGWRRARAEVIDPTIERHHGRIVKLTGDGFLAEFSTVESAVRAALDMQQQLAAMFEDTPSTRRVAFRMGVNIDDVWVDSQDVYGAGVNVAARLEGLAVPGGVCVTDAVREAIKHKIIASYVDIGMRRVKNVAEPVRVWRVGFAARGHSTTARRKSRWLVGLAVSGAVVLVATATLVYYGGALGTLRLSLGSSASGAAGSAPAGDARAQGLIEPNSIAVLRFLNIGGSEDMRIFSDGLGEDLIDRLTAIPPLRVSSRGDSFAFDPNTPSQVVRNRLRVAYYIEGSVRKTGDSLRVVAQLIDSASGFHIDSRTFDKALGEFSELQDEITKLIASDLRVALPSLADAPVYTTVETASFDAYLAYRRGMDIIQQPTTREGIERALEAFNASLKVDPDYAAAFAGICLAYATGYDVTRDTAYIDQAERSCGAALGRNPNLIVVYDALGGLYVRTGRYADAEKSFMRALDTNPNDVPALTGLGDAYQSQRRFAEAEQRYRQAVGLQPGNWRTYNSLGNFLVANGRYTEAADAYREVVDVEPQNATGWGNLGTSLMLAGDFAEAGRGLERAVQLEPVPRALMNLGLFHYYLGEFAQAEAALRRAIQMAPQDYLLRSALGDALAGAGDTSGAQQVFAAAERLLRPQLDVNTRDAGITMDLAWITAMLDRLDDSERLIASALELAPKDPYVHFYDALIKLRRGEPDAALDQLEAAVEMGYSRALIRAEPHLAPLRDRERFANLVRD